MAPESYPSITNVGSLFWIEPLGKPDLIWGVCSYGWWDRTLQANPNLGSATSQCAISEAESTQTQFTAQNLCDFTSAENPKLPWKTSFAIWFHWTWGRWLKPAHFVVLPKFGASYSNTKLKLYKNPHGWFTAVRASIFLSHFLPCILDEIWVVGYQQTGQTCNGSMLMCSLLPPAPTIPSHMANIWNLKNLSNLV